MGTRPPQNPKVLEPSRIHRKTKPLGASKQASASGERCPGRTNGLSKLEHSQYDPTETSRGGWNLSQFRKATLSKPGEEQIAPAPFGGHVVIHATAEGTGVIREVYRFRCGHEEFEAHPGAVVIFPSDVPHSFRNIGDGPGQIFATVTPGGFEQFFEIGRTGANAVDAIALIEAEFGMNAQTIALSLTSSVRPLC